jgi:hypothetical protein
MAGQAGAPLVVKLRVHDRIAEVYADHRWPTSGAGQRLRDLAVAMLWTAHIERCGEWAAVAEKMGWPGDGWVAPLRSVIAADVPHYQPPSLAGGHLRCDVVGARGGRCARRRSQAFRVTDPVTGRWRIAGFCARHHADAHDAWGAEQALQRTGGIPEPAPNAGGLLPCHAISAGWPGWYAWALPGWVPHAWGVCRDDWPDREAFARRGRLRLVPAPDAPDVPLDAARLAR